MYQLNEFKKLFEENSAVKPFSFDYKGEKYDLSAVKGVLEQKNDYQFRMIYDVIPNLLRVILEVNSYKDFPVIEYTPYLENIGETDTGIISEFSSLDYESEDCRTFGEQYLKETCFYGNSRLSVRYHLGSKASGADFLPQRRDLFSRPGSNKLELECHAGRCSTDFLPFFGVDNDPMNGVNIALGWSCAWKFSVEKEICDTLWGSGKMSRIRCGMKRAAFKIHPGERLMQPGILLHFRDGKNIRDGQNEFRRFMIAHFAPRNSRGELIKPPLLLAFWGGLETDKQILRIQAAKEHRLPYEGAWVDAGWMGSPGPCPHFLENSKYTSDWGKRVGSWDFNTWAHPHGLKPIADAAHQAGMRLLVWFESLRVDSESGGAVLMEHPEWLLGDHAAAAEGKEVKFLFNIGIPEARKYLFNIISGIMEREGIDDYREDFNMEPDIALASGDEPDRIGVTEMKFVEGFYLFWEELHKRFPNMYIDNCASGGRRLDYKAAAFSFPLCQSDFACFMPYEEECVQLENLYLDDWLPLHGTLNWGSKDPYHAVSALGGGLGNKIWQYNGRDPKPDHDYAMHRKIVEWGILLRDLHMKGDVYPQVEAPELDMCLWNGQQIHLPDENRGAVLLFRRKRSPDADFQLHLSKIDPEREYEVVFFDGEIRKICGRELALLTVHLDQPRSFQIFTYKAM